MRNVRLFPIAWFVVALLLLGAASCKKKSNDNPFGNVRIATVDVTHGGAIEHYRLYYDTYNNIDSMSITGDGTASGQFGFRKFNYFGSSWTVTDEGNFTFTVYANTAGVLLKVLIADTLTYSYENNQLTQLTQYVPTTTPPYHSISTTYFEWKNGDLITATTGSIVQAYSYLTSRNGQPGDALRLPGILNFGKPAVKTAHLPQGVATGHGQGESYVYSFDDKGRISSLMKLISDSSVAFHDTLTYGFSYY